MSYEKVKKGKTGRKMLSWLLTVAMVITLMPVMGITAHAEVEDITLYFNVANGKLYTDYSYSSVYTEQADKWSFADSVLTLKGFEFQTKADYALVIAGATTIKLEDGTTNTLVSGVGSTNLSISKYGIWAKKDLTITGDTGVLNVTSGTTNGNSTSSNVYNKRATNGLTAGIYCYSGLKITGGTVNATGGEATGDKSCTYGVMTGVDDSSPTSFTERACFVITRGTLNATSSNSTGKSIGMWLDYGSNFSGGIVNATGGNSSAHDSQGINVTDDTYFSGTAKLVATSGDSKTDNTGANFTQLYQSGGEIRAMTGTCGDGYSATAVSAIFKMTGGSLYGKCGDSKENSKALYGSVRKSPSQAADWQLPAAGEGAATFVEPEELQAVTLENDSVNGDQLQSVTYKDSATNICKIVKLIGGPSITVGAQVKDITAGTAGSATFAVNPSGFDPAPTFAANSIKWYTTSAGTDAGTAPTGITPSFAGNTLTMAADTTATAGSYYFKVFSGDTYSGIVTLKILSADGAAISGDAITGDTETALNNDITVTLTGMTFGEIAEDADVNAWFSGLPTGAIAKIKTAVSSGATTAMVNISGTIASVSSGTITGGSINNLTYIASGATEAVVPTGSVAWTITAPPDSWVGSEGFFYAASKSGNGWDWNKDTKTLTLSGVDASRDSKHGIQIAGDATLILEGANKTSSAAEEKAGLYCSGDLTVKGSGTLELCSTGDNGYGAQAETITLNSGYINVSSVAGYGLYATDDDITIRGGYVNITSKWSSIYATDDYIQTGGYVKAAATGAASNTVYSSDGGDIIVKAGYLDAENTAGSGGCSINADYGGFSNEGGVVKATASGTNSNGIGIDASFTGGVTIVSGAASAINGSTTSSDDEKVWKLTEGVPADESAIGESITGVNVVIAKSIAAPANGVLDGVYIYKVDNSSAFSSSDIVNVSGGSYLENAFGTANTLAYAAKISGNLSGTGTLVGVSAKGPGIEVKNTETASTVHIIGITGAKACNAVDIDSGSSNVNVIGVQTDGSGYGAGVLIGNAGAGASIIGVSKNKYGVWFYGAAGLTGGIITGVGAAKGIYIYGEGTFEITDDNTDITAMSATKAFDGTLPTSGTSITYAGDAYDALSSAAIIDAKVIHIAKGTTIPPIPPAPSTGGSGGSATQTIPVSGDTTVTKVNVSTSGTTVTIKEPTTTNLDKVIATAEEKNSPIKIDTSSLSDSYKTAVLPANTIKAAADSKATGFQIVMPDGSIVDFDKTAAKAIANAADNGTLTLSVEPRTTASADEKTALGGKTPVQAIELNLVNSKGTKVSSFDNGSVKITAKNIKLTADPSKLELRHIEGTNSTVVDFTSKATAAGVYDIDFLTKSWSVYAFVEKDAEIVTPPAHQCPYTDISTSDWSHEAIEYVTEKGLFGGTADKIFSATSPMTRGMLVTVLYRMEGSPTGAANAGFKDVKASDYYAAAVDWGYTNGVITGFSATEFAPDKAVTREQMAAIMYRYSTFKKYDTSAAGSLGTFTDAAKVSAYAKDAVIWANGAGLVTGMGDGTLAPQGTATREQVAAIFQRFCENAAK